MGTMTKWVEGKLSSRNIIPMGQSENTRSYPGGTTARKIVVDAGMDPDRVEVMADGEELDIDSEIGGAKNIQILPKQKGGFGEIFQTAGDVVKKGYVFIMKMVFLASFAKDIMLILAVGAALLLGMTPWIAIAVGIGVSAMLNLIGYNAVT